MAAFAMAIIKVPYVCPHDTNIYTATTSILLLYILLLEPLYFYGDQEFIVVFFFVFAMALTKVLLLLPLCASSYNVGHRVCVTYCMCLHTAY